MKITYSTFSEKGQRHENQDFIKTVEDKENERYAFILCDGMGGHSMGGMASKIIATSLARDITATFPKKGKDILGIVSRASHTLDTMSEIYRGIQMGATMVLACLDGDRLTMAHCGDSRCYVYTPNKRLRYRTWDHSEGGYMWSELTRGFFSGCPDKAIPEIKTIRVKKGDRILLCSDGMWASIIPEILRDRMLDNKPLEEILDTFKFLCEKDSEDNYSAILVKID